MQFDVFWNNPPLTVNICNLLRNLLLPNLTWEKLPQQQLEGWMNKLGLTKGRKQYIYTLASWPTLNMRITIVKAHDITLDSLSKLATHSIRSKVKVNSANRCNRDHIHMFAIGSRRIICRINRTVLPADRLFVIGYSSHNTRFYQAMVPLPCFLFSSCQ